jgi:plastocyanin
MKKIYILMIASVIAFNARATTQQVTVSDNVFTPSNFTVNTGDTIMWMWTNGFHTTTSTSVPAGAATWDVQINQTNQEFMYVATVAGSYNYQCSFHASMGMVASFTVLESSGISENLPGVSLNIYANPVTKELQIDLNTTKSSVLNLVLNDMTGREVKQLASAQQGAGEHHMQYNLAGLTRGVYLLKLNLNDEEMVRKIIIQ